MKIHLSNEYPESTTDGPGIRYSVYTQGCRGGLFGDCISNCTGCHNPETHSFDENAPGSYWVDTDKLAKKILTHKFSYGKLTLCGGDPIWQVPACIELIQKLKKVNPDYNILAYTGLSFEYIKKSANKENRWLEYLECLNTLIDGPFILEERDITLPWRGSPNQRIIDVKKSLKTNKIVLAKLD